MKKVFFFLVILIATSVACKKNSADNKSNRLPSFLPDIYTEVSPVVGRSFFNFINDSLVSFGESGVTEDSFIYSISVDSISMKPTWTNQYPASRVEFKIIDSTSFQIANQYASIPEDPPSYMIYKKQ